MSQKPIPGGRKSRGDPNPFQFEQPDERQPPAAGAVPTPGAAPLAAPAILRPHLVDYLLILLGFALSVCLARVGPLPIDAKDFIADARARTAISSLPDLMRLPEGVVLLGPVFLAIQFLLGRRQGLTTIGWLWVLSWLGVAVLNGATIWKGLAPDTAPAFLPWIPCLWYAILGTSMAVMAVVFKVLTLFSRRPAPWTHTFGAALLLWSGLLAGAILAVARFKL